MQQKHKQLLVILAIFVLLFGWGYWRNKAASIPEEVKIAYVALQKLRAATQTGVSLINYEQLLIEAKTSVNLADTKLPVVVSPKILKDGYDFAPENRLESISSQMQKIMDTYVDVATTWRHKITNKNLSDTPEGKAILSKYAFMITSETDKDIVIQKLWDRDEKSMELLTSLVEK